MCQVSYSAFHLYCVTCCVSSHVQLFCDPMGYSPPGSSVHGISQARILEWVAIFFSRGSSQPRNCQAYCIGRRILHHCATREAPLCHVGTMINIQLCLFQVWKLGLKKSSSTANVIKLSVRAS